jgi:uncharacterized protein (TIGR00661 family)
MTKILYAIQGTGNGHVCRALEIIPVLNKRAQVDILISGNQSDIELPFPIRYKFNGLGFIYGKKGGINLFATYRKGKIKKMLEEIRQLPVEEYDLVISDFEPVSSWACKLRNKPCIALSHQAAVMNKKSPRPKKKDAVGNAILKSYAPATSRYGFHFARYDENIFTPVIRQEVRQLEIRRLDHYTVYLPAYSDARVIRALSKFEGVTWHIFSKHFAEPLSSEYIRLYPVNNKSFLQSMATCRGVLCGAGFETPAEALFLRKKLLVVPMKGQFEQHCNAAALKELGLPILKSLRKKNDDVIEKWLQSDEMIDVHFPDDTERIVNDIIDKHIELREAVNLQNQKLTVKKLRKLTLKALLLKLK